VETFGILKAHNCRKYTTLCKWFLDIL